MLLLGFFKMKLFIFLTKRKSFYTIKNLRHFIIFATQAALIIFAVNIMNKIDTAVFKSLW